MPEVSGVIRSLRPFPKQLTCAPEPRWTSAQRRPINSDAQAGLSRKPKQGIVASPCPGRSIGASEQRVTFLFGQEGNKPSVKALWRDGEYPLDHRGMFRMAKRSEAEQRADRGQPGITGAHAIVPLALEVVEEGADERCIEMVDVQLCQRRLNSDPLCSISPIES